MKTKNALPKGINATDLERPSWEAKGDNALDSSLPYDQREFGLWYTTGFGWCVPTLSISNSGARTYAVVVEPVGRATKGAIVRIGKGPHVIEQHTVYVRKGRRTVLQAFIDLRTKGQGDAGLVRDRISSRRAQGSIMRAQGRTSWRWDV